MNEKIEKDSDVCLQCGAEEGQQHDAVKHGAHPEMERRREEFGQRMADLEN